MALETGSFEKELKDLINKHSIENECDMPDFILANMIVRIINGVGKPIKANLTWHGCNSVCHPLETSGIETDAILLENHEKIMRGLEWNKVVVG